jgi:hypothetical protein
MTIVGTSICRILLLLFIRFLRLFWGLLPLEFGFQGFYFLLLLKFFLVSLHLFFGKRLTGFKLVVLYPDGEERPALPASVRTLIGRVGQGQTALSTTFRAFNF